MGVLQRFTPCQTIFTVLPPSLASRKLLFSIKFASITLF
jgi:hypothetical protein